MSHSTLHLFCNIDSSVNNVSTKSVGHACFPVGVLWKEHVVAIIPVASDAINDTMTVKNGLKFAL